MPQQVRTRFQKTVAFVASQVQPEDLSRGMVYRELYLRLRGQLTCTNANNTQANTLRGDEWGVLQDIRIVANNTDIIKQISGADLWWYNYFNYGARPKITAAIGDGATANPSFDSTLIIPFWMPNSTRPLDTALDARELADLKIEARWGTFTDINSAATGFTTAPTLEVASLESFNVNGPFAQWRTWAIQRTVTASSTQFQIPLPVGPLYRGFLITCTDAGSDSSAILNNFKWLSGSTVFADVRAESLREIQILRTGAQRDFSTGAAGVYGQDRRSTKANRQGIFYYDHVRDGFLTESIDTLGFSENMLELDVTVGGGTTLVTVYPQVIYPVRLAKAA